MSTIPMPKTFGLKHHRGGMTAKLLDPDDLKPAIEQACRQLLRYRPASATDPSEIHGLARVMFDVTAIVELPHTDVPTRLLVAPFDGIELEAERVNSFDAGEARIAIYLIEGEF